MSFIPHLHHTTPVLFRDSSFDRDYLPDSYHHFGLGVHPIYRRSFSLPANRRHDPPPVVTKDGFEAHMDVFDFAPNEITVKTYDTPRTVVIEGKHEPRKDGSDSIDTERRFTRKLIVPPEIDFHSLVATLSSDGILSIRAQKTSDLNERVLPILQTGPANINIKHQI
ncbi:heat shock protein 27-like [Culicoides brevitarsis]|uniref:heat shock protein 27-like n=1 Tax=Culicoides brevitarsis TaxID=469753 RepID=UPI00307B7660